MWSGKAKGFTVQPMIERFRKLRDSEGSTIVQSSTAS